MLRIEAIRVKYRFGRNRYRNLPVFLATSLMPNGVSQSWRATSLAGTNTTYFLRPKSASTFAPSLFCLFLLVLAQKLARNGFVLFENRSFFRINFCTYQTLTGSCGAISQHSFLRFLLPVTLSPIKKKKCFFCPRGGDFL